MENLGSFYIYIVKVTSFVFIIFAICNIAYSPIGNKKTKKALALFTFVPMAIIAILSYAQSLTIHNSQTVAVVTLCSGVAAIFLAVCMSFGSFRHILTTVIGNFIYDILKFGVSTLIGIPTFIRNIFRR